MKLKKSDFEFRLCTPEDFEEILSIQDEAFSLLEDSDILRKNTNEMLFSCLNEPQITLGAFYKGELAAFSVLYFPDESEALAPYLKTIDAKDKKDANNKLCIVKNKFRGNGLQSILGLMLEPYAKEKGIDLLCATVSPKNKYSMNNMKKMGYTYDSTTKKYGGLDRNIYYKFI